MEVGRTQAQQTINSEEERYNSFLQQRRAQQAAELEQMENQHRKKVQELADFEKTQEGDTDKAYKVELSRQVEVYQRQLDDQRKAHETEMKKERVDAEKEFDQFREREKQRLETYRKNQEVVIEKMHEKYVSAGDEMERSRRGVS